MSDVAGRNAPDGRNVLERLAESFIEAYRRGESPEIEEYAKRHPELSDQIRELFSTLLMVEKLGSVHDRERRRADDASPPPERLGEFAILREVGRGGMGVVYEAEQEHLGRHVALKVLPFHRLMDARRLERFEREARAAASLEHPNIVPVYGIGEAEGVHYYAMQFIHGEGLDKVLAELRILRAAEDAVSPPSPPSSSSSASVAATNLLRGSDFGHRADPGGKSGSSSETSPKPSKDASPKDTARFYRNVAHLGLQVADALSYAHGLGIVHRDIKPSNLILETGGKIWVTDFGLAKAEGHDEITLSGEFVGTLRYMAPERFRGWSDPRSDIYSLGLTLYEILTCRPAFDDTDRHRLMKKVLEQIPPRPRELDPRIPRDLETIVLKAIAREPASRYHTAEKLAEDLRLYLEHRPIRARQSRAIERGLRWCRRNPVRTGLLAGLIALTAASTAMALKLRHEMGVGRESLRAAYLEQARASRWSGRQGQRFGALAALSRAARIRTAADLRDEAAAAMALLDVRIEWECPSAPDIRHVVFDPQLRHYALQVLVDEKEWISNRVREIRVHRVEDHELIARHAMGEPSAWLLGFSPDGRRVAFRWKDPKAPSFRFCLWEYESDRIEFDVPFTDAPAFDYSADGRWLAIADDRGVLRLYRAGESEEWKRIEAVGRAQSLSFSPRDRLLAIGTVGSNVKILDLVTGKTPWVLSHPATIMGVAWHPSRPILAVACFDEHVYLWDPSQPSAPLAILKGHSGQVTDVQFIHRGDTLVSCGWDGKVCFFDPLRSEMQISCPAQGMPLVASDGRHAGFEGTSTFGTWEVARATEYRVLRSPFVEERLREFDLDLDPDGRLLVTSARDGFRLWDVGDGRDLSFIPLSMMRDAMFAADGSLITCSDEGVLAWSIDPSRAGGSEDLVGPSRKISVVGIRVARACDSGEIVLAGKQGIHLIHPEDPSRSASLGGCPENPRIAISPDGRWIATGAWQRNGVRVLDAQTKEVVAELPGYSPYFAFSPCRRWLVVGSGKDYRFWRVGDWQGAGEKIEREATRSGGCSMAFSPDGSLLAIPDPLGVIRLFDVDSRAEIARLEGRDPRLIQILQFSPCGTRLAGLAKAHEIQLWDLREIRRGLLDLGLDWPIPPFPPAEPLAPIGRNAPSPAGRSLLKNPRFGGVSGALAGDAKGIVPDRWRAMCVPGGSLVVKTVPLEAGALFPESPAANAVLLRLETYACHLFDDECARFPMIPGRHYRATFHARSANEDGTDQSFETFSRVFSGPPHRVGENQELNPGGSRRPSPMRAGRHWRRFIGSAFRHPEAGSGALAWRCLDDGGENALLIAWPELEELAHPTDLACKAREDGVILTWKNHALHERLRVLRDGEEIAALDPKAEAYTDRNAPPGRHTYAIEAVVLDFPGGEACEITIGPTRSDPLRGASGSPPDRRASDASSRG